MIKRTLLGAATMNTDTWWTMLGPITFDKNGDGSASDYVIYIRHGASDAEM